MLNPTIDIDSDSFATLVGGQWRRTFASRKQGGQCIFVFERQEDTNDVVVLRNDRACPTASELQVPGFGPMFCHSYINDPAFAGLKGILESYPDSRVLRYRPGKRITLAATHRTYGPVIIKSVARGIEGIFQRQRTIWTARKDLEFAVSEPVACIREANTYVQRCLPGVPIDITSQDLDRSLIGKMAGAMASLHECGANLRYRFDVREQRARSMRYAHLIKSRVPDFTAAVDRVFIELDRLENQISNRAHSLKPIHGSLHSHQWLCNGDTLALVDFDRASMGHTELDIATFLAEIDYESPDVGFDVNRTFLQSCSGGDPTILAYYRAHKHFAKAFKASKSPNPEIALGKTLRNLGRAMNLLSHAGN